MADVLIRRAQPRDARVLAQLMRDCFLDAYADCSTPANVAAYLGQAFGESQQAAELVARDRMTWIAEDGARRLGYAQLRLPSPPPPGVDLDRPAQLHRIYLAGGAAGSGLGRRLLDTVHDAARTRGADGLWLSVWTRAPGPIGFYERHGYRIVGRATFTVGDDPLDDWIMQARFDG